MSEDASALDSIRKTVEDIKSILVLTKRAELDNIKAKLLPKDSMKTRIYESCDGSNTTKTIAAAIGKDEGYVRANLSVLRRDGLIRSSIEAESSFMNRSSDIRPKTRRGVACA